MNEYKNPTDPVDDAAPEPSANFRTPQKFDISKHKVEDVRAISRKSAGKALTFSFGKPKGVSRGVGILTKLDYQLLVDLVVLQEENGNRFYDPTPEFDEPELGRFVETVHIVPAVDVTTATAIAFLWAFRITGWEGYRIVFNALAQLDDASQGLWVCYLPGAEGKPPAYIVEPFPMEEAQRDLWRNIQWPRPEDIQALIPKTPFKELLKLNLNLRRAWDQACRRKEGTP